MWRVYGDKANSKYSTATFTARKKYTRCCVFGCQARRHTITLPEGYALVEYLGAHSHTLPPPSPTKARCSKQSARAEPPLHDEPFKKDEPSLADEPPRGDHEEPCPPTQAPPNKAPPSRKRRRDVEGETWPGAAVRAPPAERVAGTMRLRPWRLPPTSLPVEMTNPPAAPPADPPGGEVTEDDKHRRIKVLAAVCSSVLEALPSKEPATKLHKADDSTEPAEGECPIKAFVDLLGPHAPDFFSLHLV